MRLKKDPVPYVTATPIESNILEWHYVVKGPEGTPYEGRKMGDWPIHFASRTYVATGRGGRWCGVFQCTCSLCVSAATGGYYWGKLVFPREYPFKPPRIEMTTPSGRFQTNTR